MGRVTPEIMAMFDGACRAKNPEEAGAHVKKVAQECQQDETWARKAICYWAGYFSHAVRLRVEKVYECEHPCFGPATRGAMDPTQAFFMGLGIDPTTFPWPMRPPPYPDEP